MVTADRSLSRNERNQMNDLATKFINAKNEVKKVIIGKEEVIEKVIEAILARGHVLIEDIPGVGKTTLAMSFSRVMSLKYKRVQFTPDVLPSDVSGFSMFNKQTNAFEYVEGAAMCNLLLADEINRTSPKTQSALLEVMEEGNVTVDGVTRKVPDPFVVIATQNPAGSAGTQLLPESQLDRFMVRLSIGYPDVESEANMLRGKMDNVTVEDVEQVIDSVALKDAKKEVEQVYVSDEIINYIAEIALSTRNNSYVKLGISPRGSVALVTMSKAMAFFEGRDYVIPEDVRACAVDVMGHRIVPSTKARVENVSVNDIIEDTFSKISVPLVKR